MLSLIGIGLNDEKDITVKGLELVKSADYVYLESYTSLLQCSRGDLARFYNKQIIIADRTLVESGKEILDLAVEKHVALLVVGDVFSATTHTDMWLRALKKGITVNIVHNASVITAVGATGLELYKFGKTTSLPYWTPSYRPESTYDAIKDNQKLGMHTLVLLDIKADESRFMSIGEAIEILERIESKRGENVFSSSVLLVGCARLGAKDQVIAAGTPLELKSIDFGESPHCLIVLGTLHFIEEEALAWIKKKSENPHQQQREDKA
ncbi:MAG: diphthine synthase [Candidatus Woesearchaeota archaeon]